MHHIPRAEDSPHTLTNIATSSVLLTPFNFNDYDVGMEAMNAIVLQPPDAPDGLWTADENSVQPDYCLPAKPSPFQVRLAARPFALLCSVGLADLRPPESSARSTPACSRTTTKA